MSSGEQKMQGLIALLMVRMILQNPAKLVAPVSVTIAASQRIAPASLRRTRRDKSGRCRSSPQRTRAGAPSQIAYALRTLKDRPCSICLLHSRLVLGKAISPTQRGGWNFAMFCFPRHVTTNEEASKLTDMRTHGRTPTTFGRQS